MGFRYGGMGGEGDGGIYAGNAASRPFTYYVDSVGGLDTNPGTQALPWQTVAKVNGTTLSAGQSVGFLRGRTWAETLAPTGSGAAGNPIYFGAYGTGANPLLNKVSARGIVLGAQSYLTFDSIDCTNTGTGSAGANLYFSGVAAGITLMNCVLSSPADYNIIDTNNASSITISNVKITATGTECVRFTGASNSNITIDRLTCPSGGTNKTVDIANTVNLSITNSSATGGAYDYYLTAISGVLTLTNNSAGPTTNHGFTLQSCTATVTASGLSVTGVSGIGYYLLTSAFGTGSALSGTASGTGSDGLRCDGSSNIALNNVIVNNANGFGFQFLGAWSAVTANASQTIGSRNDGWAFAGSGSNFIGNNLLAKNGQADGFSCETGSTVHDITLNYCTASGNGIKTDTNNGDGFTCHDNIYHFNLNYPIAYNNTQSGIALVNNSQGTVYNATLFNNGGAWLTQLGGSNLNSVRGNIYITTLNNPTTGTSWTVENTIAYGGYPVEVCFSGNQALYTLNYNLFFHPADGNFASLDQLTTFILWATYHASYEPQSLYGDPLFTDATNGNFALLPGSPGLASGLFIPGISMANPPNRGAV